MLLYGKWIPQYYLLAGGNLELYLRSSAWTAPRDHWLMKIVAFTESLPRASHCSKYFIISYNPHNNPMGEVCLLSSNGYDLWSISGQHLPQLVPSWNAEAGNLETTFLRLPCS